VGQSHEAPVHTPVPEEGRLMPRRLKTYQTSLGFFDLAVAAASMKAAAEAWCSKTNDFKRGFAKEPMIPRLLRRRWQNQASF
jgi:hypothetical protein